MARRNVNGEGSIRQRADGRYEGRVYVSATDDTRKRASVYGDTWEEVHEEVTRLKSQSQRGEPGPVGKMSVAEYFDYWLTQVARERIRPTTYVSYEQLVRSYIVPGLGRKSLARLQAPDLRTFLNTVKHTCQCCALRKDAKRPAGKRRRCALRPKKCCESHLSDGTIRYIHRVLRVALQDAVLDGILTTNVAKNLRLTFRYRPKFTALTAKEATALLEAARGDRLYAVYAVALALGLRRGEALGLRWVDVDFDQECIFVRQALHRVEAPWGPVKTDDSDRVIGLPGSLAAALRDRKAVQERERAAAGKRWQDNDLVFCSTVGTPVDPRNLARQFAELCDRAGTRKIRFHDLRHSCATLLYGQGVPIENIQDILGHSPPPSPRRSMSTRRGTATAPRSTGSASCSATPRSRPRRQAPPKRAGRTLGSSVGVNAPTRIFGSRL
ncbi:MAG: site-specific integrase [Dactylosporangium sp.]|nr:site-specific integrase [Dactylosporangium sp.]NNJ61996.1 site-specific integrase [Dactylosporangium sp.]